MLVLRLLFLYLSFVNPAYFVSLRTKIHISGYRTKEQLGYNVECSPRVTYRVFGFCFCIQSSEYNPVYLQGRIDNFLNGLEELLVRVPHSFNLHVLRLSASLWDAIRLTWLGFLRSYNRPTLLLLRKMENGCK